MAREKILVIQTAFIGDAVLTLPMLKKLKALYPDSTIDVVTTPVASSIFRANPYTYKVYSYDKKGSDRSISSLVKFAGEIKKENYTRIYSPHRSFRTSMLVLLSGVRETFGFSNASFHQVYKNLIHYNPSHHEVQRNLELIGDGGISDWRILPEIIAGEAEKKSIQLFLKNFPGEKFAAVAPGSVWKTKRYPKEKFIEVIRFLLSESFRVLLIGGSDDAEYCSQISAAFEDGVTSAAGKFSIVETVELLRQCSILISNDSAPTHFGMCADIPVVTIYCSTVPKFGFYPYNHKSASISYDSLSCKPCGIHGRRECPIKTFDCAYKIDTQTVADTIRSILKS